MDVPWAGRYAARSVRRLFALVVSLLMLLPAGSVSAQAYFCHMKGKLTSACCCQKARADAPDPSGESGPAASQGDCCDDRALSASAERRSVGATDVPIIAPPVVLAVLPVPLASEVVVSHADHAPPRARAPPPPRQAPLYILNRAFLS